MRLLTAYENLMGILRNFFPKKSAFFQKKNFFFEYFCAIYVGEHVTFKNAKWEVVIADDF